MQSILGGLTGVLMTLAALLGISAPPNTDVAIQTPAAAEPTFGAFAPAGGLTYYLQSSIGLTNTTITLSSFQNRTDIPLTMALLNTDIAYATLDPQTSISEFISFTGITQNANGTATLTGVTRGLSDIYPFTASSTMRQPHSGQSRLILSDPPQLFNEYAAKRNTEYVTGAWGFQGTAPTSTACASAFQLCNKAYVDSTANAGAATSTEINGGIVELGTLAEQAASYDGGATKPTVIQTKNSTSTCQVVGAYNIVASSTIGKLDKGCFDQTAHYNLTGSTTLATTTIQESSGGLTPVGSITAYASTTAPSGWLLANGSAVSRTTYYRLFQILGTSYGVGDGSTTFNVPNLLGRNILMASSTANVGQTGGESNHTLTTAEMPAHTHPFTVGTGGGSDSNYPSYASNQSVTNSTATGNTGGGGAFNVLDPYLMLQYIIKY